MVLKVVKKEIGNDLILYFLFLLMLVNEIDGVLEKFL